MRKSSARLSNVIRITIIFLKSQHNHLAEPGVSFASWLGSLEGRCVPYSSEELGMQEIVKKLCPFCAGEIPVIAALCDHCGQELHSMKLARPAIQPKSDLYKIVRHGEKFAIEFRGEIKVDGLDLADLPRARGILSILNSFIKNEKAG